MRLNNDNNLELLKSLINEKAEKLDMSTLKRADKELKEIISTIFAAAMAAFISHESIVDDGIIGVIKKVVVLLLVYLLAKKVYLKCSRLLTTSKQINELTEKITDKQARNLVARYDYVACGGLFISKAYLSKYEEAANKISNLDEETLFNLFESLRYSHKSIDVLFMIACYKEQCINHGEVSNGVPKYRFKNTFNEFGKTFSKIEVAIYQAQLDPDEKQELKYETDEIKLAYREVEKKLSEIANL